ncbi:MAG TPA: hypothetical protein VF292_02875 [Rhodanobacteraceae bacterium]
MRKHRPSGRKPAHYRSITPSPTLRQASLPGMAGSSAGPGGLPPPPADPEQVVQQCARIRCNARHSLTLHAAARDGWFAVTDASGALVWRDRITGDQSNVKGEGATTFAFRQAITAGSHVASDRNVSALLLYIRVASKVMVSSMQAFGTSRYHGEGGMYAEPCEYAASLGVLVKPEFAESESNRAVPMLAERIPFGPRRDVPLSELAPPVTEAGVVGSAAVQDAIGSVATSVARALRGPIPAREPIAYRPPLPAGVFDAHSTRAVIGDLILHANAWTPVEIVPAVATAILAYAHYPQQRAIDETRLRTHMNALLRTHWDPFVSDVHFCICDGVLYLLNGQHRMLACERTGRPLVTRVLLGFAKDAEDLFHKYSLFDAPISVRTTGEVIAAADAENTFGYPKSFVEQVVHGLDVFHTELQCDDDLDRNARLEEIARWRGSLDVLREAMQNGSNAVRERLLASKPLAVLLYLMRYRPVQAETFVRGVVRFDTLDGSDPRNHLGARLERSRLSRRDTGAMVAHGWNVFCGKPGLRKSWPPVLADTPLEGNSP